jgi:curved DNA-binding protein
MRTHYQTLGIPQQATADDIKHSYRSLIKRFHPDLFPSGSRAHAEAESRMREINLAYAALSNARKRASYDETLRKQAFYREPKPEHCPRCGEPTLYWHVEGNVGLCESCGRSSR